MVSYSDFHKINGKKGENRDILEDIADVFIRRGKVTDRQLALLKIQLSRVKKIIISNDIHTFQN